MFELASNKGKIKNFSSFHIINKIACAPKHPKFLVCSRYNFITVPIITKVTCNILDPSHCQHIQASFLHGYNEMQQKAA